MFFSNTFSRPAIKYRTFTKYTKISLTWWTIAVDISRLPSQDISIFHRHRLLGNCSFQFLQSCLKHNHSLFQTMLSIQPVPAQDKKESTTKPHNYCIQDILITAFLPFRNGHFHSKIILTTILYIIFYVCHHFHGV